MTQCSSLHKILHSYQLSQKVIQTAAYSQAYSPGPVGRRGVNSYCMMVNEVEHIPSHIHQAETGKKQIVGWIEYSLCCIRCCCLQQDSQLLFHHLTRGKTGWLATRQGIQEKPERKFLNVHMSNTTYFQLLYTFFCTSLRAKSPERLWQNSIETKINVQWFLALTKYCCLTLLIQKELQRASCWAAVSEVADFWTLSSGGEQPGNRSVWDDMQQCVD